MKPVAAIIKTLTTGRMELINKKLSGRAASGAELWDSHNEAACVKSLMVARHDSIQLAVALASMSCYHKATTSHRTAFFAESSVCEATKERHWWKWQMTSTRSTSIECQVQNKLFQKQSLHEAYFNHISFNFGVL